MKKTTVVWSATATPAAKGAVSGLTLAQKVKVHLNAYFHSWKPRAIDLKSEMALARLPYHELKGNIEELKTALKAVEANPAWNIAGFLRLRNATLKAVEKILHVPVNQSKVVEEPSRDEQRTTVLRRLIRLYKRLTDVAEFSTYNVERYGRNALVYEFPDLEPIQQAFHELFQVIELFLDSKLPSKQKIATYQGQFIIRHNKIRVAIHSFLKAQPKLLVQADDTVSGDAKQAPAPSPKQNLSSDDDKYLKSWTTFSAPSGTAEQTSTPNLHPEDDVSLKDWAILADAPDNADWVLLREPIRPHVPENDQVWSEHPRGNALDNSKSSKN